MFLHLLINYGIELQQFNARIRNRNVCKHYVNGKSRVCNNMQITNEINDFSAKQNTICTVPRSTKTNDAKYSQTLRKTFTKNSLH